MPVIRPWTRLAREAVYSSEPWLAVYRDEVELPDGRHVGYHWIDMPAYAVVVARDGDGRFLMFQQYRYGVQGYSLCLPGGMIDPGETPEQAARRELLEETGFEAGTWIFRQTFVSLANFGGATGHFFQAEGCRRVTAPADGDLEDMHLVLLTPDEVRAAIGRGEVNVTNNLAAIAVVLAGL